MAIDVGSLGRTIRALRERRGWSIYRLAERSGVDKGQLAKLEAGAKGNLTLETLNKLGRALGIPASRLLAPPEAGDGIQPQGQGARLLELKRALDKVGLEELGFMADMWQAPVRGYVRAGNLCLSEQEEGDYLIIPRVVMNSLAVRPDKVFALRIAGESLSGDGIHEGDHILVLPTSEMEREGRIYIVRDPATGESMVKHLKRSNGRVELSSSNPDYPTRVLDQVEITGRVIYLLPHGQAV